MVRVVTRYAVATMSQRSQQIRMWPGAEGMVALGRLSLDGPRSALNKSHFHDQCLKAAGQLLAP